MLRKESLRLNDMSTKTDRITASEGTSETQFVTRAQDCAVNADAPQR